MFYFNMHRVSSLETMVLQNELHVLHHRNCEMVKMFALHSLEANEVSTDGSQGRLLRRFRRSQLPINAFILISDALHTFSLGVRNIFLRP